MGLKHEWGRGEKVIANGIYGADAPLKVRAPGTIFRNPKTKLWRGEYELGMNINRWMKQWAILHQGFCHDLTHHESFFVQSLSWLNFASKMVSLYKLCHTKSKNFTLKYRMINNLSFFVVFVMQCIQYFNTLTTIKMYFDTTLDTNKTLWMTLWW